MKKTFTAATHDKKQVIALYGGSFNPIHNGHVHIAKVAKATLQFDKLWMMVSPASPLKDPATYAPQPHRLKMCQMATEQFSDWLEPTDFEKNLNTNQTAHILRHLKETYPDIHFIWIMGADNLTDFHKWGEWQYIIDNFPLAIFERPGDNGKALSSPAASYAAALRTDQPDQLKHQKNGWSFITSHQSIELSASSILKQLRAGKRKIKGLNPKIEHYILQNKLYDIPAIRPKPPTPH